MIIKQEVGHSEHTYKIIAHARNDVVRKAVLKFKDY